MGKQKFSDVSGKGHVFLGLEIDLFRRLYFYGESRITLPSDIILDRFNIGLGFHFGKQ